MSGYMMMQRTANKNVACERRICKRSAKNKVKYHCLLSQVNLLKTEEDCSEAG